MQKWNWQTSLLMLVVSGSIVAVVTRFVLTGDDVPTGIITLLSFFGGAILGVERIARFRGQEGSARGNSLRDEDKRGNGSH